MDPSSSSDTDRLRRVNALLEEALAMPEADRARWLQSLPPQAQALAPLLRSLLARAVVETDTFMRKPVGIPLDADTDPQAPLDQSGDRIGPYRLLRELGEGGMATVWLAERADGLWQRQVACKLPRAAGLRGLAERMARERDILARLEHPHIARLYDAGLSDNGRPYLAMEYVEGVAIDVHCRVRGLNVAERLRLMLQVLRAVSYAHAHLVVHRDLKPNNILVTAQGEVRLLDFGVAGLLEADAVTDTPLTARVGRALTLDYASPEQIGGASITVASDVYSLGVVLYELLTEHRPYAPRRRTAAALEEAIVDADVPLASTRVSNDRARARALRGDVDTILTMALRKVASERYPSVEALADDIERHLAGMPVRAQPDSFGYRAAKFVRRHRGPLVAGVLASVAVIAGIAGTVIQARHADRQAQLAQAERDRALRELSFAESAEELMRFVLSEASDKPFTTRELLQRAETQVQAQFADNPPLRARMQLLVADLYGELGDFQQAEQLLLRARETPAGMQDASVGVQVDCTLAGLYAATGQLEQAKALFDTTLARLATIAAPDVAAPLTCHTQRATLNRNLGDAAATLADAQAAIGLIGKARPGQLTNAIVLDTTLGDAYAMAGRYAEAIAAYDKGVAALENLGRGQTTAATSLRNNLAIHLSRTGQLQRSAAVYRAAIAAEAGRRDGALLTNYGRMLADLGRHDEAMALFEQALAEHTRHGDRRGLAFTRLGMAPAWCGGLDLPRCDAGLAEARSLLGEVLPAAHSTFGTMDLIAARASLARGQPALAGDQLRSALRRFDAAPDRNLVRIRVLATLARVELQLGEGASARSHAEEAVTAARAATQGIAQSEWLGHALLALGDVRAAQGDAAGAAAAWREALAQLHASVGPEAPMTREARERVARAGAVPPK